MGIAKKKRSRKNVKPIRKKKSEKYKKPRAFHSDLLLPEAKEILTPKATLIQNYESVGIAANPNKRSKTDSGSKAKPLISEPLPEKERGNKMNFGQGRYIKQLMEKYGEDYTAMRRDIKLNFYQHTEAQLKRMVKDYKKRWPDEGAGPPEQTLIPWHRLREQQQQEKEAKQQADEAKKNKKKTKRKNKE